MADADREISRLVAHSGTAVTELAYRKQSRPVVKSGAATMTGSSSRRVNLRSQLRPLARRPSHPPDKTRESPGRRLLTTPRLELVARCYDGWSVNGYLLAALGFAALAAIVRLSTIAQALLFLRWLIKTGKGDPQVLRLALPILKALPALLREDRRWAAALRQLFHRSEKAGDEDSSEGGGEAR